MTELPDFWRVWSPCLSHVEDTNLDLESINELSSLIEDPVLVVGAGHGLLVQQLQKKGLKADGVDSEPAMVAYAEKRRGLKLVLANGANMPFADASYKTSVIATGVVDWLDDEGQIRSILNEALRVTDDSGKVLVAFYRASPSMEGLMRKLGLITDKGIWRARRTFELFALNPIASFAAVRREANLGFFSAFLTLIKGQIFLSRKERKVAKSVAGALKQARRESGSPRLLIDSLPEFLPYRNEDGVRTLFRSLGIPIHRIMILENCLVVHVAGKSGKSSRPAAGGDWLIR